MFLQYHKHKNTNRKKNRYMETVNKLQSDIGLSFFDITTII